MVPGVGVGEGGVPKMLSADAGPSSEGDAPVRTTASANRTAAGLRRRI